MGTPCNESQNEQIWTPVNEVLRKDVNQVETYLPFSFALLSQLNGILTVSSDTYFLSYLSHSVFVQYWWFHLFLRAKIGRSYTIVLGCFTTLEISRYTVFKAYLELGNPRWFSLHKTKFHWLWRVKSRCISMNHLFLCICCNVNLYTDGLIANRMVYGAWMLTWSDHLKGQVKPRWEYIQTLFGRILLGLSVRFYLHL